MQPGTATLFGAVIGICGALAVASVGHVLGRSWQREQWLRDNRKEESKELLGALADSFSVQLQMHAEGLILSPELQRMLMESTAKALRVIRSCIYIADVVELTRVEVRWPEAVQAHQNTMDVAALAAVFGELRNEIVKAQLKGLTKLGGHTLAS